MNLINKQVNRVALVTGSARRIGAAIIHKLHQVGFIVVIHYNQSRINAEQLAAELNLQRPNSALALAANLNTEAAAIELVLGAVNWGGQLDLLVNNASAFIRTPAHTYAQDIWDHLFTLNVKAPFWLSNAAYAYLSTNQGSIVNCTDSRAEKPLKQYSVYCQSKAALQMQTKVLAVEFAPKVRVNAVAPGAIAWPEGENTLSTADQERIIASIPLQRHGSPEFIAEAVIALVENEFITGQTIYVDGGRRLLG